VMSGYERGQGKALQEADQITLMGPIADAIASVVHLLPGVEKRLEKNWCHRQPGSGTWRQGIHTICPVSGLGNALGTGVP